MITINGSPLPVTLFPDNTSQVWKLPEHIFESDSWVHIVWDFQHEGEFMQIAQLKELLDVHNVRSALRIKYLPYGRQDKFYGNTRTFALHTFAKLLNSLDFEEVIIHDPHSQVALDLIHNSRAVYPIKEVEQVAQMIDDSVEDLTIFCFPDNGALTKYSEVYKMSYRPYVHGVKVRDQLTGHITDYHLEDGVYDKSVLIVDDICDGGATFVILAKALYEAGAKEVNLFVSHGIFSNGLRPLFDAGIKRVFTKDGEAGETQNHITYRRL
jgi:ribose-phosphate pyrophosphokinase